MKNLQGQHEEMIKHGVIFSLTVSPETLDYMTNEEFEEFWKAYGMLIRLLSRTRTQLNINSSERR